MKPVIRFGVGGPVGSGKTALVERMVPLLLDAGYCPAVVANDIFTREDERILRRALAQANRVDVDDAQLRLAGPDGTPFVGNVMLEPFDSAVGKIIGFARTAGRFELPGVPPGMYRISGTGNIVTAANQTARAVLLASTSSSSGLVRWRWTRWTPLSMPMPSARRPMRRAIHSMRPSSSFTAIGTTAPSASPITDATWARLPGSFSTVTCEASAAAGGGVGAGAGVSLKLDGVRGVVCGA